LRILDLRILQICVHRGSVSPKFAVEATSLSVGSNYQHFLGAHGSGVLWCGFACHHPATNKIVLDAIGSVRGGYSMFSKTISQKSAGWLTQVSLLALIAAVGQLSTVDSLAQSTFGQFVGTVKDPSGAVIPGCAITVKNLGTSLIRTAGADETGSYTVVNLEPGDYEITMEQPRFQKVTRTNLQLLARQTVRVDGVMPLVSQAQTVEVSVEAVAPIETEVSNIAETKLGRELIDLPIALGSRATGSTSAFSTLTTQPGVEIDNNGQVSV